MVEYQNSAIDFDRDLFKTSLTVAGILMAITYLYYSDQINYFIEHCLR